jgi:hypothetical protein
MSKTTVQAGIIVLDAYSLAANGCWFQNAAASYKINEITIKSL